MRDYELQILATERLSDEAIRAAEQEDVEIVVHNPIDSGIDEG